MGPGLAARSLSKPRMPNDAELVELLSRSLRNDKELVEKVLVSNPARLHGFGA